jgi:hypothetical protein
MKHGPRKGSFRRPSACHQEQCNEIVGWIVWVEVFRVFDANPLKEMVGTRRLELLTSTVSKAS